MTWEHAQVPFALTVHRAEEVPSQFDRTVFEALRRSYPAMRSSLQGALDELWSAARETATTGLPDVGGSLDLWVKLQLQGIGLHDDGHAELIFGFLDPNLPEGAFIVSVHGTSVTPVEYVAVRERADAPPPAQSGLPCASYLALAKSKETRHRRM